MAARQFCYTNAAWYAESVRRDTAPVWAAEIFFGLYDDIGGGTFGELAIRWYQVVDGPFWPCLEAYDDAWPILAEMPDVLAALAAVTKQTIQPKAFCLLLEGLGFQDVTPYERPEEE